MLVDYLRVTFKNCQLEEVLQVFSVEGQEWTDLPHGGNFYQRSSYRGGVRVFYDGVRPEMGVHVEVKGEGCREMERDGVIPGGGDWVFFLGYLARCGGHFTRLDLAVDDRAGELQKSTLRSHYEAGQYACRAQGKSVSLVEDRAGGFTLYYGSRTSCKRVRIYDKAAQQQVEGHWMRCELELKDEAAQAMVGHLVKLGREAVGRAWAGILRGFLRFTEGEQSQACRRAEAGWWVAFLAGVERARLDIEPALRTMKKAKQWIAKQVLPTLGMLSLANDIGIVGVWEMIAEGRRRLREEHVSMLLESNRVRPKRNDKKGRQHWFGKDAGADRPEPKFSAAVMLHAAQLVT